MNILICLSNVPDTTTRIKFTGDNTALDDTGVQWIINPWDELALTRALELKEKGANIDKITVINVGGQSAEPTIRKALAIGADDAVRVDAVPGDAYFVAAQIADFAKSETYDIIFCGIESSDYNGSMVGGMLAEMLEYPSVSSVSSLEIDNGEVKVKREIDGGQEFISTNTPFVAVVQKGIALDPRIPSMRGIMMARKKPMTVRPPAAAESLTGFESFDLPTAKAACKMIDAEDMNGLVNVLQNEIKVL